MAEVRSPAGDVWQSQLARTPPAKLDKQTVKWLASLPPHARPTEVAVRFPHVANKFALLWPAPEQCSAYFEDLMLDKRGGRKGFPADVAFELAVLKNHHDFVARRLQQDAGYDAAVGSSP